MECLNLHLGKRGKQVLNWINITILISLILMAAFRDGFKYADYENYVNGYFRGSEHFELSFDFLCNIAKWIDPRNYYVLFLLYASLGVSLKYLAIKRLTSYVYASMAIYLSYFYVLHELIQIRVGVAAAIGLIAVKEIYNKKLLRFVALIALASFFHMSAWLYLFFHFLDPNSFNWKKWIFLGFTISVSAIFLFNFILPYIPFAFIQEKLAHYALNAEMGIEDPAQITGTYYIIQYTLMISFAWFVKKISNYNMYSYLLLKMLIIGVVIRIAFNSFNPVLAVRGYELCMISSIVLYPFIISLFKQKAIGILCVTIIVFFNIISVIFLREYVPI